MTAVLFDDFAGAPEFMPEIGALKLVRVAEPGPRLDAAYDLLARIFDPAVLDSKETYVDLLSPGGPRLDGFSAICVAAMFDCGGDELIAGFLSSNLMWIDIEKRTLQLAIGNIGTSPALRQIGFRGVGTALWRASIELAERESNAQQGNLEYSVAEAETDSLGYWRKLSYLWPSGLHYLQSPLKFDAAGRPVHKEVAETFLVCPLQDPQQKTIDVNLLRQMILAIYRNWCVETNRQRLSPTALQTASDYVMEQVLPRVMASIPKYGRIELC